MRTWTSLPAGLRCPSLIPTACPNCPGSCGANIGSGKASCSRSVPTLPSWTSKRETLQSHRPSGQGRIRALSIRAFSTTPCARIVLEDDEEDAPRRARPTGRLLRRENHIDIHQENLRNLLLMRAKANPKSKSKPREPPKPKWVDPKQVRRVEQKALRLNEYYHLADTFLILKFARVEWLLSQCHAATLEFENQYERSVLKLVEQLEADVLRGAMINARFEHQYCVLVFDQVLPLEKKIASSDSKISQLGCDLTQLCNEIFDRILWESANFISHTRTLLEVQYLHPRDSARARIDKLLDYTKRVNSQYEDLQAKSHAAIKGLEVVISHARVIGKLNLPGARQWYLGFHNFMLRHKKHFAFEMHNHRAKWLTIKRLSNPLAALQLWDVASFSETMSRKHVRYTNNAKWMLEALMLPSMEARRKFIVTNERTIANYMFKIYMQQWTTPKRTSDYLINRHWRQLDVIGPFEMFTMANWWLQCELVYLIATLSGDYGPMWTQITDQERDRHKNIFLAYLRIYVQHRKELLRDLQYLKEINWIRLGVEEKLHALGTHDEMGAKDLFVVSSPLSQSRERFRQWVDKFASISNDGWLMNRFGVFADRDYPWTFFPLLTAKRRIQLEKLSQQSTESPVVKSGRATPRARSVAASRTIKNRLRARKHRHKRAERRQRAFSAESPVSDPQASKDHPPQARPAPEQPIAPEKGAATKQTTHVNKKGQELRHSLESSKRSFSTSSSAVCGHAGEHDDESLQLQSQARGAPPIETTSKGPAQPTESDAPLLDPPISPERETATTEATAPLFWSHNAQRGPDGQKIIVHYCRSLQSTEEIARLFLGSKVIGFDLEWKAQASATDTIQNNLSLIQIANEERIALFQVALFKPARNLEDFIAPSLKRLLESSDVIKVGVAIKADSTRLRKYLGIDSRSIFELSHLYKLVKYGQTSPGLVNKRSVNLSDQIEEHLGLPLEKSEDVRCGDWSRPLNYRQVQYAATDPYACLCLFNIMEQKRLALDPVPPFPAFAELNLPIVLSHGEVVNNEGKDSLLMDAVDVQGNPS